jgi:hypothetical protein
VVAAWISATISGAGAKEVISQAAATSCIQVPMLEITAADQIRRKLRSRSGAQGKPTVPPVGHACRQQKRAITGHGMAWMGHSTSPEQEGASLRLPVQRSSADHNRPKGSVASHRARRSMCQAWEDAAAEQGLCEEWNAGAVGLRTAVAALRRSALKGPVRRQPTSSPAIGNDPPQSGKRHMGGGGGTFLPAPPKGPP